MLTYGYFTHAGQSIPAYDPGLDIDCPICNKKLKFPIKTISLMRENDNRSFFYRTHKGCYDNLTPDEKVSLDSQIIDLPRVDLN